MADPFPAVAEAAATGETAELFADIRATVGVRVVNLVWRHLATIDGALPWAWAAVKPLYLQGMADRAAVRFREGMSLPALGSLAGRAAAERRRRAGELRPFQHHQPLRARRAGRLAARRDGGARARPRPAPRLPAPDVTLPKLASAEDVSPETWALVLRLNRFGDPQQVILASMYRHLAHAPAFLRQVEAALAPVEADGSLARAIVANRADAHERAKVLARAIDAAGRPCRARSRPASRPSSITPSARWSPSAAPFAWRELASCRSARNQSRSSHGS